MKTFIIEKILDIKLEIFKEAQNNFENNKNDNSELDFYDNDEINTNFDSRLLTWWSRFSLRTKLLAIATLVVSLLMTGITFFALNSIQRDAGMNDTRYARDLGLLLSGNVTN